MDRDTHWISWRVAVWHFSQVERIRKLAFGPYLFSLSASIERNQHITQAHLPMAGPMKETVSFWGGKGTLNGTRTIHTTVLDWVEFFIKKPDWMHLRYQRPTSHTCQPPVRKSCDLMYVSPCKNFSLVPFLNRTGENVRNTQGSLKRREMRTH